MITIRWMSLLTVGVVGMGVVTGQALRDPFWPIGEDPTVVEVTPEPTPEEEPEVEEEPSGELTDEELRREAQKLADEITESISSKGIGEINGEIVVYLTSDKIVSRSSWVSEGEHFLIELNGQRYQMDVVKLTRNHIELAPKRLSATSSP